MRVELFIGLVLLVLALLVPSVAAAEGWYLLVPRLSVSEEGQGFGVQPGRLTWRHDPDVRTWKQEQAFDSAQACEQAKQKHRGDALVWRRDVEKRAAAVAAQRRPEYYGEEQARAEGEARLNLIGASTTTETWERAVCVSAEDARLRSLMTWYLLLPPSDSSRPLREWWQLRSYSSQQSCEEHRAQNIEKQGGPTSPKARDFLFGVCVASDDLRLR